MAVGVWQHAAAWEEKNNLRWQTHTYTNILQKAQRQYPHTAESRGRKGKVEDEIGRMGKSRRRRR